MKTTPEDVNRMEIGYQGKQKYFLLYLHTTYNIVYILAKEGMLFSY